MAVTQGTPGVVLAPRRSVRMWTIAIVALVGAFAIGMAVGNVITAGDTGFQTGLEGRVVESDEALSELALGARHFTADVPAVTRYVGASEELVGGLDAAVPSRSQQAATARLESLADYYAAPPFSPELLWAQRQPESALSSHRAETARLQGLAGFHAVGEPFSPELIWAERQPQPQPQGAVTAGTVAPKDRPHGMQ